MAVSEDGAIPRTPSGKPDLPGTYDIANLTPFERHPKYGDQKAAGINIVVCAPSERVVDGLREAVRQVDPASE